MSKRQTIKLTADMIRYISLFESLTGASVKDCFHENEGELEKLIFIVDEGTMGLAIGKKGSNIKKIKQMLGKELDVLEYSKDPLQFIRNILWPLKLQNAYMSEKSNGEKAINLQVQPKEKKLLFARNREKLKKVKGILQRHYDIDEIQIR